MSFPNQIYLSSLLLDPGRWSKGRQARVDAGTWNARMLEAGFAGWELWEPHDPLLNPPTGNAPAPEPVGIYNTYLLPDESVPAEWEALATRINQSGAFGVKFNVSPDPGAGERALPALDYLLDACPKAEFWCECHPRTALEKPAAAARWISGLSPRVGIIVHPFSPDADAVTSWFRQVGDRVRHLHLNVKGPDNRFARLSEQKPRIIARLEDLDRVGFKGTVSLEFTRGIGGGEADTPELLFENALADLRFLEEVTG